MRAAPAVVMLALWGCEGALPPLRDAIEPGRDPFVVFVAGEGRAGGDLYAVAADGGPALQITYSGVGEMRPALSPDGSAVAFLRGSTLRDSAPGSVWVMNLINGRERRVRLPRGAGAPERVGWMDGGIALAVKAGGEVYRVAAPPAASTAEVVPPAERARAESALAVLLGSPVFARVVPCRSPGDLCVVGDTGAPGPLARGARDAARWGTDSVAYLSGGALLVRPLGPGRERRVRWTGVGGAPRQLTVFAGPPGRGP